MGVDRRYVVAELHGRLGNQLFQFASAYAIARRHGVPLRFCSRPIAPHDLLLPVLLGDRYREASPRELLRVGQLAYAVPPARLWRSSVYRLARLARRARRATPPSVTYWQHTGRYRPEVFDLTLPVYLQGHLQSERYFVDVADEVAGAITWPGEVEELPCVASPTVAVSFRRGDYNAFGWTLGLDYYDAAVARLSEHVPTATFVLFGDDRAFLELAQPHIARYGDVAIATQIGTDPISQLWLMTQCDHCIIANSSFSWWGAWLGDMRQSNSSGRIVIAPSEYGSDSDRLPARWSTIDGGTPPI